MAQLAEQLTRNEQVAGSNPATSSKKTAPDRVLFFLLSLPGFEVYPPCGEIRPQAPKNSTRQGAVFLLSLPGFEVYPPCGEIRPQAQKSSTRQGAAFGLPKKPVIASQSADWRGNPFPKRPILRLFAGLQLKDYGFPRRFAPRSKCPWGTDWRGNPSHLRAGCHTRL